MAHAAQDTLEATKPGKPDLELTLEVSAADEDGTFTIAMTAKVADLIAQAIQRFHLAPGDAYDLALASKPTGLLQPERPLVSYSLRDGDKLLLTSRGGGV